MIATLDNDILLEGSGDTDGRVEDTNSYRAERCGNIATFSTLNIIRRVYEFTPTSVELDVITNHLLPLHGKTTLSVSLKRLNRMSTSSW
jgi:hypothetical protein